MMKDVPLSDHETWLRFIYQLQPEDLPNATAESFQSPAVGDLSPAFAVGDGCDSVGGTYRLTVESTASRSTPLPPATAPTLSWLVPSTLTCTLAAAP